MIEYRIVKRSMSIVIGEGFLTFGGVDYYHAYFVQKKTWYGKWKKMKGGGDFVSEAQAKEFIRLAEAGKLTNNGEEIL